MTIVMLRDWIRQADPTKGIEKADHFAGQQYDVDEKTGTAWVHAGIARIVPSNSESAQ